MSQRKLAVNERVSMTVNNSVRSSAMSDVYIVLFTFVAHFWLVICKSDPIGYSRLQ